MRDLSKLIIEIRRLKTRVLEIDTSSMKLTETDTRQGLINPLFRVLGWDFGDFRSIRSELRHKKYNEPVDYAFYASSAKETPILLLEAKQYGKNLEDPKTVKQLCGYLGEMGVQWGVLSDGNRYVMYNSKGGLDFGDQKYLSLQLKTADTDDGLTSKQLAEKLHALLGRESLEDETIQATYKEHIVHTQIERALESLLSEPFHTLIGAIRREFKEKRVRANPDLRLTPKDIIAYLETISDEGKITIDLEAKEINSDEEVEDSIIAVLDANGVGVSDRPPRKRITIKNLFDAKMIQEGDNWKMEYKGDVYWGRITGNGEIDMDGKTFPNPSKAGDRLMVGSCNGWWWWRYKNKKNVWCRIDSLRQEYKEAHQNKV